MPTCIDAIKLIANKEKKGGYKFLMSIVNFDNYDIAKAHTTGRRLPTKTLYQGHRSKTPLFINYEA